MAVGAARSPSAGWADAFFPIVRNMLLSSSLLSQYWLHGEFGQTGGATPPEGSYAVAL
ncbi:MAG: hypothetical protein NVS9B12_14210 [Vulcanimicrobiaceae bacterium]